MKRHGSIGQTVNELTDERMLAPIQFIVFLASLGLVLRTLATGEGAGLADRATFVVDPDPLVLTVPADAAAGEATYSVTVEDVVGRTVTHELSWNVLPKQPPTGSLALADGAPGTVQAGFSFF